MYIFGLLTQWLPDFLGLSMHENRSFGNNEIITSSLDVWRINLLLSAYREDKDHGWQELMALLQNGKRVLPGDIPPDVVTMNCFLQVTLFKAEKERFELRLVYPVDEEESVNNISVFSLLGAALLGMKEGEEKTIHESSGETVVVVVDKILYQPEKEGHYQV